MGRVRIRPLQAKRRSHCGQTTVHGSRGRSAPPPGPSCGPPPTLRTPPRTPPRLWASGSRRGRGVSGWGRGLAGEHGCGGGRCGPFRPLVGSGLNKGRCLAAVLRASIGCWIWRAWFCEVSSGRCKSPGAAANWLQMLLGRGGESSRVRVCELDRRALERPGEGWRPPGPRPPRPRANSWSCCCSGSRRPPRLWPATLRWAPGERPSPFSCAREGARPAGGRAVGFGPGGERVAWGRWGWSGAAAGLARLPRPPLLGAALNAGGRAVSDAAEAK